MSSKKDLSKSIVSHLDNKKVIRQDELKALLIDFSEIERKSNNPEYAVTRAIKNLKKMELIEEYHSGQNKYLRLSSTGRVKANSYKMKGGTTLMTSSWDGKWRIILLDLPEKRKTERDSLRYLLKKAGFVCLKNSAWISPYPFEFMFENIKNDLHLSNELIIIVTDYVDESTKRFLQKQFL